MKKWTVLVVLALATIASVLVYVTLDSGGSKDELEYVAVTWTEEAVLPYAGVEEPRPFQTWFGESHNDTWQVFLVERDGAPKLIHETRRWLSGEPTWGADGQVVLPFLSADETFDPPGGRNFQLIDGHISIDSRTTETSWQYLSVSHPYLSPDGSKVLTGNASVEGGINDPVKVVDPNGTSWRFNGPHSDMIAVSWSPDNRRVLLYSYAAANPSGTTFPPPRRERTYYAAVPGEERAIVVGRITTGAHPVWSPDGSSIAFVERADPLAGTNLAILDVANRRRLTIHLSADLDRQVGWNPQADAVVLGDAVIDASSGRIVVEPGSRPEPQGLASPDGKKLAISQNPLGNPRPCPLPQPAPFASKTTVVETVTGTETVVADCAEGLYETVAWITNDRLLLRGYNCTSCDNITGARFAIASLGGGPLVPLTAGLEAGAGFDLAGRGRLLISGDKLRVYDSDGTLLKEISPPEGLQVTHVSWSPDGNSFVYIVGPYLTGPI